MEKRNEKKCSQNKREIPPNMQYEMLEQIVYNLNILALALPCQILMLPLRKGISDEWLKENGLERLINQPTSFNIKFNFDEKKDSEKD